MLSRQVELAELQPKLLDWIRGKMPKARDLAISNLERSGAGISNETFLFNLSWQEKGKPESEAMVLRCAPRSSPVYPDYDLSLQFRVMKALHAAKLPVARVHWLEQDEKVLGTGFYVMGRIEGVVPPEFPPYHSFGVFFDAAPQKRARMWWSAIEAMSRVHQADWKKLGLSFLGVPGGGTGPLDRQLDYFERYLGWAKDSPDERQPVLEAALKWLRENRYQPARVTLCWGDARMPNTMFSPDGDVVALFDWEMAFLGDPQADLAFFLLLDWVDSEGYGIPRLEGAPGREETVRRYQELTGWKVDQLHYNEVFAVFRAGIIMMKVLKNFKKLGVAMDQADAESNNPCTQRLASLLGLPAPGAPTTADRQGGGSHRHGAVPPDRRRRRRLVRRLREGHGHPPRGRGRQPQLHAHGIGGGLGGHTAGRAGPLQRLDRRQAEDRRRHDPDAPAGRGHLQAGQAVTLLLERARAVGPPIVRGPAAAPVDRALDVL